MRPDGRQDVTWELLFRRLKMVLDNQGREGLGDTDDCWIDDDNIGTLQHKIYFRNLELLHPIVIEALQRLLSDFSAWEFKIAIVGPEDGAWPDMGLTIRAHEVIDGLQRQYFPKPYRQYSYRGSRPGTERD